MIGEESAPALSSGRAGRLDVGDLLSAGWFDQLRRGSMRAAVHGALGLGRWLGPRPLLEVGRAVGALAGLGGPLRERLRDNFRRAGVVPTEQRLDGWFRRFGTWAGWSLAVYQAGLDASGLLEHITFDDSVRYLDEAVARGRGVVLAAPHMACHEIAAGFIHHRHPLTALVRESKSAEHGAIKRRWYEAVGLDTVHRARGSSLVADVVAVLRVLRGGRLLAVTPDVLMPTSKGVPVNLLGRQVSLSPGVVVLAQRSGAPLVTALLQWEEGRGGWPRRLRVCFTEPLELPRCGDRDTAAREGMQRWCGLVERYLRRQPENWMFWLDKRWTQALRA
jgi:KDO2-lipid IV(A) lauroyltransferase